MHVRRAAGPHGLVVVVVVVSALVCAAAAAVTAHSPTGATAYRLLQADVAGHKIGSRTYSADGHLAVHSPRVKGTPYGAIMVLPISSTAPELLAEHTAQRSGLAGVLVVLPAGYPHTRLSAGDAASLLALERQLLQQEQQAAVVPVFFAADSPHLAQAVADTEAAVSRGELPSQHADRWHVRIQGSLATRVPPQQGTVYVAQLRGSEEVVKHGVWLQRTLLIAAHYDSFSAAPGAPGGADATGSGAAAALLLLRGLHALYASRESQPRRNVMVVLAQGGPYGHYGLARWLAEASQQQIEAIDAAIVLDSIGGSVSMQQQDAEAAGQVGQGSGSVGQARLHAHHAGAGSNSSGWLAALQQAAQQVGVELTGVEAAAGSSSSGDRAAAAAAFGHEHLAARGIPALTLSRLARSPRTMQLGAAGRVCASSIGDVPAGVDAGAVLAAAQVVAAAAARWLYPDAPHGLRALDLLAPDPAGDVQEHRDFLRAWLGLLSGATSMMPFDQAGTPAGALLHESLWGFVRAHAHKHKRSMWPTAGTPAALEAWTGFSAVLEVRRVAGFTQDMVLTAGVVTYLTALFCALVVATRGWEQLAALLQPQAPRKKQFARAGRAAASKAQGRG